MKVLWLCNYSLKYINHILKLDVDFSQRHPVPWLYYLVKEIEKRKDIELHILTLQNVVDRDISIEENGIHYHIIKDKAVFIPAFVKGRLVKKKLYGVNIRWEYKAVRKIEEINPDVINIHGTEGTLQALCNKFDIPTVVWMQGLIQKVNVLNGNEKYNIWLKNEQTILSKQRHFITFPGEMESIIKGINPEANFYNIYHPNPDSMFDMFYEKKEKDNDLIFVGELIKRKGIEDFINVVARLKEEIPSVSAKIIGFTGDVNYREHLSRMIVELGVESNINQLFHVDTHEEVMEHIRGSKLFMLPTYVDTGPRSIAESMTVGAPVISYNVDGIPSMIKNGYSGIMVEPGDINALTEKAFDLLKNPERAAFLSGNAYEVAESKYKSKGTVDKLLSLYTDVIEEKNLIPS